jgi:hypothetical protein
MMTKGPGLPANSFDVVIHRNRQFAAAFSAAAFQNFAPILSLHAGAEAMNTKTAMNSRLIGPFGHSNPLKCNLIGTQQR